MLRHTAKLKWIFPSQLFILSNQNNNSVLLLCQRCEASLVNVSKAVWNPLTGAATEGQSCKTELAVVSAVQWLPQASVMTIRGWISCSSSLWKWFSKILVLSPGWEDRLQQGKIKKRGKSGPSILFLYLHYHPPTQIKMWFLSFLTSLKNEFMRCKFRSKWYQQTHTACERLFLKD